MRPYAKINVCFLNNEYLVTILFKDLKNCHLQIKETIARNVVGDSSQCVNSEQVEEGSKPGLEKTLDRGTGCPSKLGQWAVWSKQIVRAKGCEEITS